MEADPGRHSAHEATALRHGEEDVRRLAVHQPETPGTGRDGNIREAATAGGKRPSSGA